MYSHACMHAYASVIRSAYKHVEVTRDQRASVFLAGMKTNPMIVDGLDSEDRMNMLVPLARCSAHEWAMFEMWQDHRREGFIPKNAMSVEWLEAHRDNVWDTSETFF